MTEHVELLLRQCPCSCDNAVLARPRDALQHSVSGQPPQNAGIWEAGALLQPQPDGFAAHTAPGAPGVCLLREEVISRPLLEATSRWSRVIQRGVKSHTRILRASPADDGAAGGRREQQGRTRRDRRENLEGPEQCWDVVYRTGEPAGLKRCRDGELRVEEPGGSQHPLGSRCATGGGRAGTRRWP